MKNKNVDGTSTGTEFKEAEFDGKLAEDLRQANPADIAAFIAASLLEMRKLAVTFKMRFLVYLLEMAYQEAEVQADNATQKDP
ncbi:MAG: hypothetical protein GY948_03760 [Alphaproteobacteria bacterium]|nr:hypothetical protein [Alphaproteobacteria bacterium]